MLTSSDSIDNLKKKKVNQAKDNLIAKKLQHIFVHKRFTESSNNLGTHIDKATTNHLQLTTANKEK